MKSPKLNLRFEKQFKLKSIVSLHSRIIKKLMAYKKRRDVVVNVMFR